MRTRPSTKKPSHNLIKPTTVQPLNTKSTMAQIKQTPANKTVSSLSNEMLDEVLGISCNAGEPSNTNEHTATAVPNSNSETVEPNAGEPGGIDQTNENPIPSKSDEGTIRIRQMQAMINIINKDHGK